MTQRTSPIICDGCEADITVTNNSVDYCLTLKTYTPTAWFVDRGMDGGVMTDMMVYPAIKGTKHFCNSLDCVRAWLGGPDAVAARKAKREEREARWNRKPSDESSQIHVEKE